MKLLVDMNLAIRWVPYLQRSGHEAIHWSQVGRVDAPDSEIMEYARSDDAVVLTNDLDFGTLLALTGDVGPSVIQLRSVLPNPEQVGSLVDYCLLQHAAERRSGALIVLTESNKKLRLLPIKSNK